MRIIACGNRDRSDDGAGILAGERLRSLGIDVDIMSGGTVALVEAWSGVDEVIIIDAVVTGSRPGTVHIWDGATLKPDAFSQPSSHGFGIAEAIGISRALNCLPRSLLIFGIEGREFGFGSVLSREIVPALETAVNEIRMLVRSSSSEEVSGIDQCVSRL